MQTYEQAQAKKQKQEHEQSDRIEPQGLRTSLIPIDIHPVDGLADGRWLDVTARGPSPSALAHLSTDTNPCTGTGGEGGAGDTSSADVSPLFASDEDGRTGQVASSQSSNDGGDDAAPPLLSQDKDDKREDDAGGDDEEERDVAPTTAAPRWAPALSFAQHRGTNARRPPSALSLNLGAGQTRESSIYSPPESVALGAQLSSDGSAPPLQGKTLIFPSPPSAASTTTTTTTTKSATTMSGQMLAIPPARGSMDGRLSPSSMSTSATAASSTSGRWTPKPLVLTPTRASVMPISRRVSTSSPLSPTASLGAQQQQPQPQDESPVLLGHARRHSAQAGLGIPPLSPVRGPRRRRSIGYGSISRLGAPMTPTDSQEPPSQPPRSATIPPPVPEKDTPPLLASSPPPRSRRSYSEDSPHMHELMKRASLAAAAARVRPHAAQDDDEEDRASEEERAERHSRLRDSLHVKADAEALLTRWREQLDELERAGAVPLGAAAHRRQVKSYAESVMTPAEHVREALDEAASDAQHDDDFVERVRAGLFAAGGERLDAPPPLQIRKNSRGASNVPVVDEQWRSSIISNLNHVIDAYASEDAPPVPAVPAQYERAVSQYEVFKGEDARSTSPSERGQSREHSTAFIDATRFSLEPDSVTPSTLNVSKSERSSAFRPDSIIDPSFLRTRTTTASTAATMMQDRLVSHFSEPSSRGSSPVPEPLEAAAPRPAKRPVMQHRLSGPRPAPFRRRSSGKVKRFGDPESWYSQSSDAAHSASATPSTMADRGEDLSTSPYPDLHASLEGGEDATETIEPHVSGLGFWGEHDDPEYGLASEARDEVDPYLDPSIPRAPIPVLPETQPLRVVAANNNAASRLSAVSEEPDMPEGATPLMDHLARRRPSAPSSDTRQANAVSLVFTEASPLSVSDAVFPSEHSQAPRSARVARDEDEGLIDLQLLLASPPPPLDELRPEDSPEEPYEPVFSEPRILSPAPGSVASSVASAPKLARAPSSSQRTRRTSTIGRKILRVFGGKQQHVPDSPDSGESWLEHPKASRSSAVRRASEANVATTPMAPTVRRASESTVMSAHDSPSSSGSLRSNSTNVPRHENGADAFNAASHRESKLSFMTALTSGSALSPIQSRTSYTSAHEAPSSSRWRSSSVPRTARRAESTSSLRSPSMVLPPGLGREEPPSMHARHSHLASAVSAPSAARAMSPAFSKDVFDELSSLTHSQPQAAPVQAQPPPPQRRRRRRQRVTRFADESSDEDSGTDGPSSGDEQDEDGDDFDLAKLPVIAPCRTPSPEPFSPELRATSPDGAATTTAAGRPLSLAAANMRASDAAMRALFRKQLAAF